MHFKNQFRQIVQAPKTHKSLSVIGFAIAVLALVAMILPTPKAVAATILHGNVNVCTTIGGYCFTSVGTLHDAILGQNGGGSGNPEQDVNIDLSTDCGGYVTSSCPFYNQYFNADYIGDPIVTLYMHDGSDCADDDGIQEVIYLASCSANAAEYVAPAADSGSAFNLINVWATNNIDNPNHIYYACTYEENGQPMYNWDQTVGFRCTWKYIPQD